MSEIHQIGKETAKRTETLKHLTKTAMGQTKADLVLKNASYVNVFTNELCKGDIAITDGKIAGIGTYSGEKELDMTGKTVVPGFIDAHIHIESSLLTPPEFARAIVSHGTTTAVCDPHEIANVCGTYGVDYMLAASENLPVDIRFMMPSCVPATAFDESFAVLNWRDIALYLENPRILGLAEMMNYPGIIYGDQETLEKVAASQALHRLIDGHAPGLSGDSLNAYTAAGIYSDHECSEESEALDKIRKGQYIMIREGTAAQNLEALVGLIKEPYAARCMFATDDKHPYDLLNLGHIDYIIRKAVKLGADPVLCVKAASLNAAQYFGLTGKGAVAPGYDADLAVVDSLDAFNVCCTVRAGQVVYDGLNVSVDVPEVPDYLDSRVHDTCRMPDITAEQLKAEKPLPVIGMVDRQIITVNKGMADKADPAGDILKMAVAERHHATGHVGVAYLKGYGLTGGAVATSIAHDSHNIICVGTNDADMACAMNHIKEMGGGITVVKDGKVMGELALPIAGLMTDKPIREVNDQLESLKACAYSLGVRHEIDPFMTLSFMSLPVIPSIRLLTTGVFDVDHWTFIK